LLERFLVDVGEFLEGFFDFMKFLDHLHISFVTVRTQ
jgi:hypothetical protein